MADKEKITRENIYEYYQAYDHFFPEGAPQNDSPYLRWRGVKDFAEEIASKTGIDIRSGNRKTIKDSQDVLEALVTNEVNQTLPTKEEREIQEEKRAKAEEEYKKTVEDTKKAVDDSIKKQQEVHDKLVAKQKKIYAKVEQTQAAQIEAAKQQKIDALREAARVDPQQLTKDISEKVKAQLTVNLKDQISEEEINFVSQKTAVDTVRALANPDAQNKAIIESAILNKLAADNKTVPKVVGRDLAGDIQRAASEMGFFRDESALSRGIINAFDKDLAQAAFGNPDSLKVSFYDRPVRGFTNTISPDQLSAGYSNLLEGQSRFFQSLGSFSQMEAKNFLMGQARLWLDARVAGMSPEITGVYNSAFVQDALGFVGLGKPIAFGETGFGGLVMKVPGASSFFSGLGKATGIDFIGGGAAKVVATEAATTVGTEAAAVGSGVAVGAEVGAAGAAGGAAAGAAAGSVVPVVGTVIGTVVGFVAGIVGPQVISWISDKYSKNKEMFIAVPVAGLVTVFAGPLAGVFAGLGTYGLMSFAGGGPGVTSSINSVVSGILSALSATFSAFLSALTAPVIAFLIGFPVLVIFILIIINSGAYVVPPGGQFTSSVNPYISVQKTAEPNGQLASPQSITYTVTIAAKKDTLTGITIKADCKADKKGQVLGCPQEKIPDPKDLPTSINAGTPYSFTFTIDFGPTYQDSLVSNTVKVTAVSNSGGQVSETGSASVCFGNCPLDCYNFPDQYWPKDPDVQKLKSLLTGAIGTLAGNYQNFAKKACSGGTINLCYNPGKMDTSIYGWHEHQKTSVCDIDFRTDPARSGPEGVLSILTHEVTHHIQTINPSLLRLFQDKVSPAEPSLCYYGGSSPEESMAEGDALFVARPLIYQNGDCYHGNYQAQYPLHYDFAKNVMFAP